MNSIHFDPLKIILSGADHEVAVAQTALCTKFGLVAAAPRDLDEDALFGCKEIIDRIDMACAGDWADRPQEDGRQILVSKPRALPRAVLWSAVLRAAADARRMDASARLDAVVATELGDTGAADALRACALAGLAVATLNGGPVSPAHDDIQQWQRRKPWTDLKSGTRGETLIARHMRLPASVRFGRRYVTYGGPGGAQPVSLALGDEMLIVEMEDSSEFIGQQEFELVWGADGRLSLDLLVDGAWRPLRETVITEAQGDRNRAASQVFRQLSEWSAVALLVQVHVLEAIEA